jgi:hypothetical protein
MAWVGGVNQPHFEATDTTTEWHEVEGKCLETKGMCRGEAVVDWGLGDVE